MSVSSVHPLYEAMLPSWLTLRDAFEGSSAVKGRQPLRRSALNGLSTGAAYLPRPPGMLNDTQYAFYLARASWGDYTALAVNGMVGAIFRKEPVVDVPAALEPHLRDVTQTGVPLDTFAEEWLREELLLHRSGVLIDFPQALPTDSGTIAPPVDARPYWIPYKAEEIRNWRTMQRQGDTVLSLVVLRESVPVPQGFWPSPDFFVIQEQIQYRVLRLDEFGQYEVSLWVELPTVRAARPALPQLIASWLPLREGVPLDFIPFVFDPEIHKSLLEGLVECNYRFFRHSADYEQALFLTASPTPYVCSDQEKPAEELLIGSSVAWWIQMANSKVGMLGLDPAGLPAHQIALDQDRKDMAAAGARLLERPADVTETRIAAASRSQGAESPIQSLITQVSRKVTQALQIHAWWAGFTDTMLDPAIQFTLNKDIVPSTMEPQMLTALMQGVLNGTMSFETYWYNLKKGEIAPPGVDADEEQALLEVQQQAQPLIAAPPPSAGRNGTARTPA